jgi:hypothetical protein
VDDRLAHLGQAEIGNLDGREPVRQMDHIEQDVLRFQITMCDSHRMLRGELVSVTVERGNIPFTAYDVLHVPAKTTSASTLRYQRRKRTHGHALTDLPGHRDRL